MNKNFINTFNISDSINKITINNNLSQSTSNLNQIVTSNNNTNNIVKKSILKKPTANFNNKITDYSFNQENTNRNLSTNIKNNFNNMRYSSLADMYLDYTLNSIEHENTRNDLNTGYLSYPDILENSIGINQRTKHIISQIEFDENNSVEFIENPIDFYEDYEKHDDIISLNVDFSNDEDVELNLDTNNTIEEPETFKFELNPQKYSLELSTLSSNSKSSKPSSRTSSPVSTKTSSSSISYYDDFYISNKLNRIMKSNRARDIHKRNYEYQQQQQQQQQIIKHKKSPSTLGLNQQNNNVYANQFQIYNQQSNSLANKNNSESLSSFSSLSSTSICGEKINQVVMNNKSNNQNNIYGNDNNSLFINFTNDKTHTLKSNNTKTNNNNNNNNNNNTSNDNNNNNNRIYENVNVLSKELQKMKLKEQQKQIQASRLKRKTTMASKQLEKLENCKKSSDLSKTISHFDLLDDFLIVNIFSKLNTIDKLMLQFVCKRWHRIIWSGEYTYKLFDSIDIVCENNNRNLNETCISDKTFKETSSKNSTFSRLFRGKQKSKKKDTNLSIKSNQNLKKPNTINIDLVLKFLLTKLLNRQTYPLCLCIETINIKNNSRITDKSVELIANFCPELKNLTLRNCLSIRSNSIEKLIENCENLKYIDLTGCYNLTNLIASNKLMKKKFQNNQRTINGLNKNFNSYIVHDTKLNPKKINQKNNNNFSFDEQPKLEEFNVCNYLYLQFIDLSYCTNINDKSIENICKSCIFIKNLYLRRCKQITDISLLYIAKYCVNLRELSLCQCVRVTDNGLKYLANEKLFSSSSKSSIHEYENSYKMICNSKNSRFRIKYLSLARCPLITDESLIYLCKVGFFQQVKYLNLRGCIKVTDKFVKHLIGSQSIVKMIQNRHKNNVQNNNKMNTKRKYFLPLELKCLDLASCSITDKTIEYLCRLVAFKPNILQRLSLRNCDKITDEGIKLLALNCKYLQNLNVTKCSKVTSQSLKEIKKNCQSCVIQHTNFSFC